MKRLSIEQGFGWAQGIAAREWRLLLPVMLAFLVLPPLAIDLLLPARFAKLMTTRPIEDLAAVEAAMAWLLPVMLATLLIGAIGMLTISALALTPRISVREAILLALRRIPVLAAATIAALGAVVIAATMIAFVAQRAGLGSIGVQALLIAVLGLAILLGTIRLAMLGPVVIERRIGPLTALGESWALAKGAFWRLFGGLLAYWIGASVALLATMTALNALILLGARLMGAPDLAPALTALVFRIGAAIVMTGSYLLIAGFYRQLAGSNRAI